MLLMTCVHAFASVSVLAVGGSPVKPPTSSPTERLDLHARNLIQLSSPKPSCGKRNLQKAPSKGGEKSWQKYASNQKLCEINWKTKWANLAIVNGDVPGGISGPQVKSTCVPADSRLARTEVQQAAAGQTSPADPGWNIRSSLVKREDPNANHISAFLSFICLKWYPVQKRIHVIPMSLIISPE